MEKYWKRSSIRLRGIYFRVNENLYFTWMPCLGDNSLPYLRVARTKKFNEPKPENRKFRTLNSLYRNVTQAGRDGQSVLSQQPGRPSSVEPAKLRVVQTQAILFLKAMSERVGSDIQRRRNLITRSTEDDRLKIGRSHFLHLEKSYHFVHLDF